jgi:GDPmannose 4,6-dehydratase
MKRALITGVSGQDGVLLAQLLLQKEYHVVGTIRKSSDLWRLDALGIRDKIEFLYLDLLDIHSIQNVLSQSKPNEIYNLAAQSSVAKSFLNPLETAQADAFSVLYLLDSIRTVCPDAKFFQAGSCEMFGNSPSFPHTENTPFQPINPYSSSKVYAHNLTVNYRDGFGLQSMNGILFNHESEFRGKEFFTRRVSMHVAKFFLGEQTTLDVGNIHAIRDIGYAGEFVEAMYLSLQQPKLEDFIIATGNCCKIQDFINACFQSIGTQLKWEGEGIHEKGYDPKTGKLLIQVNPANFRPTDIVKQLGDPSLIQQKTGWKAKLSIQEIAHKMVQNDIQIFSGQKSII